MHLDYLTLISLPLAFILGFVIHLYLFFAIFLGMVISAIMKKSVAINLKPKKSWGAHLVGGAFMGVGTVLIPGGNDTLILKSMPDRFLEECI